MGTTLTIAALLATGAQEVAKRWPEISKAAGDLLNENIKNGNLKTLLKGTEFLKETEKNVKKAVDYIKYNDKQGGWKKK